MTVLTGFVYNNEGTAIAGATATAYVATDGTPSTLATATSGTSYQSTTDANGKWSVDITNATADIKIVFGSSVRWLKANDKVGFASITSTYLGNVQIGVSGTNEIDTSSGNLTIDSAGGTVTVDDNVVIEGSLNVKGDLTTVTTSNTQISDKLIELNNGATGSASGDSGIVIERGDDTNVFIGYDESADVVTFATGTFTGASTGDLTLVDAEIRAGKAKLSNLDNAGVDTDKFLVLDASGNVDFRTGSEVLSDIGGAGGSGANTGDVTLAGTPDYITLSGQEITRGLIDLTSDVSGVLPDANVAADLTISGGTINNTTIGAGQASTGVFTTLEATTGIDSTIIGGSTPAAGTFTTVSATTGTFTAVNVAEDGKLDFTNTAPGTSGDATGIIFSFTAGATLAVGDVVYMHTDGKVALANADSTSTMPALGICTSTGTDGSSVDVMIQGVMKLTAWSFTTGADIFISSSAAGDVTATAPSTSGHTVQKVGVAVASDTVYFNFNTTELVLA